MIWWSAVVVYRTIGLSQKTCNLDVVLRYHAIIDHNIPSDQKTTGVILTEM